MTQVWIKAVWDFTTTRTKGTSSWLTALPLEQYHDIMTVSLDNSLLEKLKRFGGHTADIRECTADIQLTYGRSTADRRLIYGRSMADIRLIYS